MSIRRKIGTMGYKQLAVEECANMLVDGRCAGVDYRWTEGQPPEAVMFQPYGSPCLLAEKQRCQYFETTVLAVSVMLSDPARIRQVHSAIDLYEKQTGAQLKAASGECKLYGKPRRTGHTYCDACMAIRKKVAAR